MTLPALQKQSNRYAARNTVLFALLGLVSVSRRVESVLLAVPESSSPEGEPVRKDEETEAVVFAALGAVSLGRRMRAVIGAWASETPPAQRVTSRPARNAGSLLR